MYKRKEATELVNYFVTHVQLDINHPAFETPFKISCHTRACCSCLLIAETVYQHVIDSPAARMAEFVGKRLFCIYSMP